MEQELYTLKNYNKGSLIYLEKSSALPYLFIIKSGKIHKSIRYADKEEIEELNAGDTFGFASCMTGLDNFERITTITECILILVHKKNIITFLSQKRDVFLKIAKDYSNKLRKFDLIYQDLMGKTNGNEPSSLILQAAEYFHSNDMIEQRNFAFRKYLKVSTNELKKEEIRKKASILVDELPGDKREVGTKIGIKKNEVIFLENEEGDSFYFIESGRVKISHIFSDREIILSILGEGEFIGEMSILNRTKRMASAIAFEDSRLLILDRSTFMDTLGDKILQKVFLSLATRLYHTYRRVTNLAMERPLSRLYDCLDYLIRTRQGIQREDSFHFHFSFDELKHMTNLIDVDDKEVSEFLKDDNIRMSYGEMVIINMQYFYDKLRRYTGIEK